MEISIRYAINGCSIVRLIFKSKTLCITEIYNATEKYEKLFSLEDKTLLSQLTIELKGEAKYGVF